MDNMGLEDTQRRIQLHTFMYNSFTRQVVVYKLIGGVEYYTRDEARKLLAQSLSATTTMFFEKVLATFPKEK